MAATPTRIIRPTQHNTFTCFALSHDGLRLATGETDGSIRVWSTTDYNQVGEAVRDLKSSVSAISFFQGGNHVVIAVDSDGNVKVLDFEALRISAPSKHDTSPAPIPNNLQLSQHEETSSEVSKLLAHQFSKDGLTLAHFKYEEESGSKFRCKEAVVYRFGKSSEYESTCIQPGRAELGVPTMSRDGKSLLFCVLRADESKTTGRSREGCYYSIEVVPILDFSIPSQTKIRLPGQCACWALDGDYLLVWEIKDESPCLSVYTRDELISKKVDAKPMNTLSLPQGLVSWKAQILRQASTEAQDYCLVYLITDCKKRILLRWTFTQGLVTQEINVNMHQRTEFDRTQWTLGGESADQIVGCALPPKSPGAFYSHVMRSVYPDFTASQDGKWMGVFSWRRQAGTITSKSGVAVWKFCLPNDLVMNPLRLPVQVMFDQSGDHFVLMGDKAVLAFKLSRFRPKDLPQMTQLPLLHLRHHKISEVDWNALTQACQVLPSPVLVKLARIGEEFRANPSQDDTTQVNDRARKELVDAALSSDGGLLAFIAKEPDCDRSFITIDETKRGWEPVIECFAGLRFPMDVQSSNVQFEPDRLFLFDLADSGDKGLALFSHSQNVAVLCDIAAKELKVVKLPLRRCLRIVQTEDRKRVAILDVDSVSIVDLKTASVTERISYKANFSQLIDMVNHLAVWSREGKENDKDGFDRRVSDDGRSVLLGWDTRKEKSIVVTPSMEKTECEAMISEARFALSNCCALCPRALCTSFVDVHDLKNGKITIGVYVETSGEVLYRFNVAEDMPELKQMHQKALLSTIFYGISTDYHKLIAATVQLHSTLPAEMCVEDQIRAFSISAEVNCVPTYEQLCLKTHDGVRDFFERCYKENGFYGCCLPVQDGKSLFQMAFLNRNAADTCSEQAIKIAKCIRELAVKSGFELSLEWTSSDDEPSDLLKEALKTRSTNQIKDAVGLYCSDAAPFNRAAALLKHSFLDLAKNHRKILEDALTRDLFVTEAQTIDVHVDFMNQELRRDTGLHIGTSDTFLDWTHVQDPKSLEKNWRKKDQPEVEKMESTGNTSTTQASLKFVRIEDAAKTGMNGIIRPLLLHRVPAQLFQTQVIKSIVEFKWLKIWRPRFIKDAAFYAFFLLVFSLYVIFISTSTDLSTQNLPMKICTSTCLVLMLMCGAWMTFAEYRHVTSCMKDGAQCLDSRWRGLGYYFGFKRNWLGLATCTLLFLGILPLHFLSLRSVSSPLTDEMLSAAVAFEAVFAFAKVWQYAQPFRCSGPLVQLINNIVRDCSMFLALDLVTLIGFSLSFLALFRHVASLDNKKHVFTAYGTFHRCLLTLFYALFADFDPEVYRSAGRLTLLTILFFVAFLMIQAVLLFHLLTSMMGDTFDRVKSTQEAQLFLGRARIIDACEAALSESECKKIDCAIDKYLYFLHGTKPEDDTINSHYGWSGRIKKINDIIRNEVQSITESLTDSFAAQTGNINALKTMIEAAEAREKRIDGNVPSVAQNEVRRPSSEHETNRRLDQLETAVATLNADMSDAIREIRSLLTKFIEQQT